MLRHSPASFEALLGGRQCAQFATERARLVPATSQRDTTESRSHISGTANSQGTRPTSAAGHALTSRRRGRHTRDSRKEAHAPHKQLKALPRKSHATTSCCVPSVPFSKGPYFDSWNVHKNTTSNATREQSTAISELEQFVGLSVRSTNTRHDIRHTTHTTRERDNLK